MADVRTQEFSRQEFPCERLREEFSGYVDGEVDTPMLGTLEAHARNCLPCAQDLLRLRELVQAMQGMAEIEPDPRLWERVRAAVLREGPLKQPSRPGWWRFWQR